MRKLDCSPEGGERVPQMPAEENKAIVMRFYEELWNGRNLDVADELIAPACMTHQLRSGAEVAGVARDAEAVKRHVAEWLEGFPDLHFTVEQLTAEADRVVSQSVMRATHTGTWMGLAPTGRRISIRMTVTQRLSEGKIVEDWVLVEALGFFQQLGLVSPLEELLSKAGGG